MTTRSILTVFASALLVSALAGAVSAQDTHTDDALERLLERASEPRPQSADEAKPKPDRPASDAAKSKTQKPAGEVEDKALDALLEKLGQTVEEPTATGKPSAPSESEPADPASPARRPGQSPPDRLTPGERPLDEHLEEVLGRKRRRNQQDQQDPQSGPLAEAVKKMREVEQKLGQEDTGEPTRTRQKEIVKDLENIIKQARARASSSQPSQRQRQTRQPGQPGNDPSDQPGNTAQGTGPQMPKKPTARSVLAENKDEWGHLPPELRAEMENVFKEDALPLRRTLIDRYYISVNRKSASTRGD